MTSEPTTKTEERQVVVNAGLHRHIPGHPAGSTSDRNQVASENKTLPPFEEVLDVSKREIVTGRVRLTTRTDTRTDIALDRTVVDIMCVPINQVVEEAPAIRIEGGTTIVPVIEERFIVVKQLSLTEELHIRTRVHTRTVHEAVELRRQLATVQRVNAQEGSVDADGVDTHRDQQPRPLSGEHEGKDDGHS